MSAVAASGAGLSGCLSDSSSETVQAPARFDYGVASGDPLADRVVLWTHARRPDSDAVVELVYEVSLVEDFSTLVSSGTLSAAMDSDFTAKVDASGLQPGSVYYYRFRAGDQTSPVGRTRTLPAGDVSEVRFAVMSCSNYPAGYFNVYREIAQSDAEFAIHLGDYIYEYEVGGYADENAATLGRVSVPAGELLALADYRLRHAQYKSDPDAQRLHAAMPMIAVWDDHEIANDTYKDGAENHDADEGRFGARRDAALQAYHEWMPIRTGAMHDHIYRRFDFGRLVSLHMLDTRVVGRDKQVSLGALAGLEGAAEQALAYGEFTSPSRQLLGAEQFAWLQSQLASSGANWQVFGQQVLMGRMEVPASVLAALNPENISPEAQAAGMQAIAAYLEAKAKQDAGLVLAPAEAALLDPQQNPRLGYNLDAWDGYIAAREAVLATAHQLGKRVVSLAGDTHNAWHSDLTLKGLADPALAGVKVGEEFATTSISSPGFEATLSALPAAQLEQIFTAIIDDLKWVDASRRGYLKMHFTADEARGEWVFVDTVISRDYTAETGRVARYAA
ncbi:alkaline phosphatase D family protein [Thauera linaloolentis]|nr:alkaline phosphatase D family protein [Thauera linaloolentis]MCM8566753.1 alkaline phosphatase D family protein [Thauera linaloolentis]